MDKDLDAPGAGAMGDEDDFHLPNPREVNRQLREQRRKEKIAQRTRGKGEGAHRKLFEEACARHPRNPPGQFAYYLEHATLHAAIGRRRQVSDKTKTDYGDTLKAAPALLKALRKPIQNASDLGRAHVLALMRYWEHQGHRESTVQWRVSLLRRFFTLIGRPQVLPAGEAWRKVLIANGITAGTRGRTQVATHPRGWRDCGVDPLPIIEAIRAAHPVVASQLDLCLWFGLRKNEATQIRPDEADKGTFLNVLDGTKGKKPRTVDFSGDPQVARRQREVLDRAKQVAARNSRQGILTISGLSLRQARNHINYVLRKFKITKKDLGVTQHGLRHQFGCDLYRELSGLPAPALGAVPPAAYHQDSTRLMGARKAVSRQMGHERASITNAYAGSVPFMEKECLRRLKSWLEATARETEAFRELRVEDGWIVGKGAYGLALASGESLQICVRVPAEVRARVSLPEDLREICTTVSARIGVPVAVSLNLDGVRPAEGVEILWEGR